MAVAESLLPTQRHDDPEPFERANVVRLVSFLGPISPELAMVDPELAERARALLPDALGTPGWSSRPTAVAVGPLVPVPATPAYTPQKVALLVAGAAAVASAVSWIAVSAVHRDQPVVGSPSAVVAPAPSFPEQTPIPPVPPGASQGAPQQPSLPDVSIESPRFVWPKQEDASAYRVALYRDGRQIFQREVTQTALELPMNWAYDGSRYTLTRGTYRWIVWPLLGAERQVGRAIVSAQYDV